MDEKIPTDNDKGIGETLNSYSEVTQEKLVCHECNYEGFMGVQKGSLSQGFIIWLILGVLFIIWNVVAMRWGWVLIMSLTIFVRYIFEANNANLFQCPQCKKLLKKE